MWSGREEIYTRLHYPSSDSYFNSGVLLVNLDYWREEGLMSKALDYISKNGSKLVFYDQDVLNALLHDCKLFLPFRYNVQDGSCVANVAFVRSQLQRWTKNCSTLLLYIIREGRNPGNINLSILIKAFISTIWI